MYFKNSAEVFQPASFEIGPNILPFLPDYLLGFLLKLSVYKYKYNINIKIQYTHHTKYLPLEVHILSTSNFNRIDHFKHKMALKRTF